MTTTTTGAPPSELPKCRTGIVGLDDITLGGLPRGRPTLVCGGAGSGKTLLSIEFLVRGAVGFAEPGVFMSFEEAADELSANVRSLGFDLDDLIARKLLFIDHVRVERSEIDETGDYDLEPLFLRLGWAIDQIGAKRVVLDTIEALFAGLSNEAIVRAELRRLFRWLKQKGVTAIITGEKGDGRLTRQGIEEYVSDCVVLLDHRVQDQLSTRRLRILKYRGSTHGTNEYPFLIDEHGITVLPITSVGLEHRALTERVSTGVDRLDTMLGGGYFRGSTVLISGTAGSGKTSLLAAFLEAGCRRGERCLWFALEESESQIRRNMRSVGFDLAPWREKGVLGFHAQRPTVHGLEMHLASMYKEVVAFRPTLVVVDPITAFMAAGTSVDATAMVTRFVDILKNRSITVVFSSLISADKGAIQSEIGISSLVDTWLLLDVVEGDGERNRTLYVLKSRGMAHSNQIREYVLSERGIELLDVYVGAEGVLTGSARLSREAKDRASEQLRHDANERRQRELERKRLLAHAQIAAIEADLKAAEAEFATESAEERIRIAETRAGEARIAARRWADTGVPPGGADPT